MTRSTSSEDARRVPDEALEDASYRAEIERRAELVRRGESEGLAWEDVRAKLRRG